METYNTISYSATDSMHAPPTSRQARDWDTPTQASQRSGSLRMLVLKASETAMPHTGLRTGFACREGGVSLIPMVPVTDKTRKQEENRTTKLAPHKQRVRATSSAGRLSAGRDASSSAKCRREAVHQLPYTHTHTHKTKKTRLEASSSGPAPAPSCVCSPEKMTASR